MEHKRKVCRPDCDDRCCNVCALWVCETCGLYEGCLTTECPGVVCFGSHGDAVYAGLLDYRNGGWTEDESPCCPSARARKQAALGSPRPPAFAPQREVRLG